MRLKPWLICSVVLAVFVAGLGYVGAQRKSQGVQGTLAGTVILYPVVPACDDKQKCSRVAAGQEVRVLDEQNRQVDSSQASGKGEFLFKVKPGNYRVEAPAGRYGRGAAASELLTVNQNQITTYAITIDTAIR